MAARKQTTAPTAERERSGTTVIACEKNERLEPFTNE